MSTNSIFDFIDHMSVKKTPFKDVDFSGYSMFVIDKLLASTNIFIPLVLEINKRRPTVEQHYKYYLSLLPKRKIYSTSIKKDLDYEKETKAICEYFECGTKDSEIYLQKLSTKSVNNIVKIIGL